MSQEKTFETVEEYAKHIRQVLRQVIVKIERDPRSAEGLTEQLIDEACDLIQAAKMKQEVDAGDFDLSTLPKPQEITLEDDPEGPYFRP